MPCRGSPTQDLDVPGASLRDQPLGITTDHLDEPKHEVHTELFHGHAEADDSTASTVAFGGEPGEELGTELGACHSARCMARLGAMPCSTLLYLGIYWLLGFSRSVSVDLPSLPSPPLSSRLLPCRTAIFSSIDLLKTVL
jgi:hypothetical protein